MSPAAPAAAGAARPGTGGAKDQVARLLTLVPFLHARGPVRLDDAAAALGVPADQLLKDLKVLLMCGLPGGYPDDLIDVDLDALEGEEGDGVIRVSNADYLARPLRLSPTEATAIIVALRALRNGARDETREVVDRALAKLEAAAAEGSSARANLGIDPGTDPARPDDGELRRTLAAAVQGRRQLRLSYFVPSRDEESERTVDPRGVVTAARLLLPRRLVPQRRGAAAVPPRPDLRGHPARHRHRDTARGAARPRRRALRHGRRHDAGHPRPGRPGPLGGGVLPGGGGPRRGPTAASRWTSWWPTSAGCSGCCCAWPRTPASSRHLDSPGRSRARRRTRSGSTSPAA